MYINTFVQHTDMRMCMHTHTNTHEIYTHTFIPWIHKCVTKRVGCRTSHKDTNICTFYSAKYYKILQISIINNLYTYKFIYTQKVVVF